MYYQNLFNQEFIGTLILGDRQFTPSWRIKGNVNTSVEMFGWNVGPYNLTGNTTLTLNYSFDSGVSYATLAIDVTSGAASIAAVTVWEVVAALNADATFKDLFEASVRSDSKSNHYVFVRALRKREQWKCYISNTSAEQIIRFNKKAGVAELPSYFARHTIANRLTYTDSLGMLIELSDPLAGFDVTIVDDADLDSSTVQDDWQLLDGRSGLFMFRKQTVDSSDRVTQIIEYHAGAVAGDLARKIAYSYTGSKTNPDTITEIPYVLTGGDLITP